MISMRSFAILSLYIIAHISAYAQDFYNLDFEYCTQKQQPLKWSIEGNDGSYDVKVDSTSALSGKKSLLINIANTELYIYLILPGSAVAGKTANIKASFFADVSDSLAVNSILFDPSSQPKISERITFKKGEWISFDHGASFPVAYSSDRLLAGFKISGHGSLRIDNVQLQLGGKSFGNGPVDFREPSPEEVVVLNKIAIPFNKNLAFESQELIKFKSLLKEARVIGLGENSHGSGSIFKSKLAIIKHLVQDLGFSVVALEAPVYTLDQVNNYVMHGKGTLSEAVKNLAYKSWQVTEYADIISWVHKYNKQAKSKVKFLGIDMQGGQEELAYALNSAKNSNLPFYQELAQIKIVMEQPKVTPQQWDSLYKRMTMLMNDIPNAPTSVSEEEWVKVKRYLMIAQQSMSMHVPGMKSRDECMAENVIWISKHLAQGEKIIVSAENDHVTRLSGRMGFYLANNFKEQYVNIGYTFMSGTYAAYGDKPYYEVHEPHIGTYEYFLSKCKYPNYLISLKEASQIELIRMKSGFRLLGSRPQDVMQFAEMNIADLFDLLICMDKSVHSTEWK